MTTAAQLAGATTDDIAAARAALTARLQTLYPTLSVRAGPLADLVLGPAASVLAAVEVRAKAATASLDPETALANGGYDSAVLNAALAGRGVTRIPAATATGTVALVFSDNVTRTVTAGTRMTTADGVVFKASISARFLPTTGTTTLTTDQLLVADGAGSYVGTVAIVADATGATGNRPAATTLTPVVALTNQIGAYLAVGTTGGANAESDAALLARLPAATSPRTTATADGAAAVVLTAMPGAVTSAVGFGAAAMQRGRSVLSTQAPGRLDLWVRAAAQLDRPTVRVTATLEDAGAGHGTWRFTLGPTAAPALVCVDAVRKAGALPTATGYVISSTTWGYDLSSAPTPAPDVRGTTDAFFSRYATATVRFVDTDTSTGGLTPEVSTKTYDCGVRSLLGIAAVQTACDAAATRAVGGDCLVRAAAAVKVTVTATATIAAGVTLTAAQVQTAVAAAINANSITNTLSGATVTARAQALLPTGTALQLSAWSGTVYRTDGTSASVSGSAGLSVAINYPLGIGPNTTAFYCDPEAVAATVS